MRTARTAAAALTALTLTGLAAACGGGGGGGSTQQTGSAGLQISQDTPAGRGALDGYTWSLYAEPQSLDYAYAFDYPPNTVLANVCEQLVRIAPGMKLRPGLASVYANPDPLHWVYTIRPGVTFHDGTPLTAADVVASLKRQMDPKVGSYWISSFQHVKEIRQTGPMQVTVTLTKPDQLFNQEMGTSAGTIESAKTLAAKGQDYGTPQGGVNCTGPYALQKWQKGQSITLARYAGYWDKALAPKSATVTFAFIQDPAARVNALLAGQADGGYLLPPSGLARLKSSGAGTLYYGPSTTGVNLIPGNLKGPLGDLRVRQALSLALDRTGLIKAAAAGIATPAKAAGSLGDWGNAPQVGQAAWDALPALDQDVAKAKELVADAGATGKKLVMATSTLSPELGVIANEVRRAGQAIGLDVELKMVAPDAYTALFSAPEARAGIDMFVTEWYDQTPDALEFYGIFQTGNFSNYGGFSDEAYDALVDQAGATADPDARARIVVKMQQTVTDRLVWIPLYQIPTTLFLSDKVTGAPPSIVHLEYPWAAMVGARS